MFGRSASLALFPLLLTALASPQAFAKKQNFSTGVPIVIGFAAGIEQAPRSGFVSGTKTSVSSFGHYFLFQPSFDLVNVAFQPYAGWHFYPDQRGADPGYTETSQAGNFSYGVRVVLAPFVSKNHDARGYFALAVGMAMAKLRNVRTYTNAAGAVTSVNTEKVDGSGLEMSAGAGMEFFLVQNYTLQIEGGYAQRNINGFKYSSTTDVTGVTRTEGADVLDAHGRKKGFHVWTPYAQLALNLHF